MYTELQLVVIYSKFFLLRKKATGHPMELEGSLSFLPKTGNRRTDQQVERTEEGTSARGLYPARLLLISVALLFLFFQLAIFSLLQRKWNSQSELLVKRTNKEIRACVLYLALSTERNAIERYEPRLLEALRGFEANISRPLEHKYPALIVHNGWITREHELKFAAAAPSCQVLFTVVNITDTSFMKRDAKHYSKAKECGRFSGDYRIMNRVFIRLVFENELFRTFDYWMRLDLDLFPIKPIKIDPFEIIHQGHYDFGYMQCFNSDGCTTGYYEFVADYVRRNQIQVADPRFFQWLRESKAVFYGNIGVGRVSLFTSKAYLKFARNMDFDGGIMKHRWDDQHTFAVAIALFSNYHRVVSFKSNEMPLVHKKNRLWEKRCFY